MFDDYTIMRVGCQSVLWCSKAKILVYNKHASRWSITPIPVYVRIGGLSSSTITLLGNTTMLWQILESFLNQCKCVSGWCSIFQIFKIRRTTPQYLFILAYVFYPAWLHPCIATEKCHSRLIKRFYCCKIRIEVKSIKQGLKRGQRSECLRR